MKLAPTKIRLESMLRMVPDLFTPGAYASVLYVGARPSNFSFRDKFSAAGTKITILEAFKKNCEDLKAFPEASEIIHGDVRTAVIPGRYDMVLWWHGPEHILESELPATLARLEAVADKIVILGCPWGYSYQDAMFYNPYEVHVSHYDYPVFEKLGYDVECVGSPATAGANITSVKRIKQ